MKKEKKKYNEPNYNRREAPFLIRLEAEVLRDGFENVKSFITYHTNKGKSFRDIHILIKERYDLKVHWMTIRRNLRKLAPPTYNRKTMGHFKRKSITKRRGSESVPHFINSLIKKGYDRNDFARVFNLKPCNVASQLEPMYSVKLDGSKVFPEKKLLRIQSVKRYCQWLYIAKKIGFDSVAETILYLYEDKEMTSRDVAWVFKAKRNLMMNKINLCKELRNTNKQKEKGEQNGNFTDCRTDV